jgi:hypothetical protein
METRPCHHTSSRIHTLACGHTIAVPRDAEPCALNCAVPGPPPERTPISSAVLAPYIPTLLKIRNAAFEALNTYATVFADTDHGILKKFDDHAQVLQHQWVAQEQELRGTVDLIGGNFACAKCGSQGQRPSFPAHMLPEHPYYCIVVGREEPDLQVLKMLEDGALQMLSQKGELPNADGNMRSLTDLGANGSGSFDRGFNNNRGANTGMRNSDYNMRQYQRRHHAFNTQSRAQQHRGHRYIPQQLAPIHNGRITKPNSRGANSAVKKHAEITRGRVEEKKRVVDHLRDEVLLEDVADMDLSM